MSQNLPSAEFIQARFDYLYRMTEGIVNSRLRAISRKVLDDKRFQVCTAARHKHQAYKGGLVVHEAEVLEASLSMASLRHLKVNYDILVTSVIFHDYGKIWDYETVESESSLLGFISPVFNYTSHQQLIRHLPRSYAEFLCMVSMPSDLDPVSDAIIEQISHCILAHHGRQEWGSPTEPKTVEAHIIHFADMLSASYALDEYQVV